MAILHRFYCILLSLIPDPVGEILANMTTKRSKAKVMEKILNLGLVEDRKDLYKRRGSKAARRSRRGRGGDSSDDGK